MSYKKLPNQDGVINSGVTIHYIDKGIDTGDVIDNINYKIGINDTAYDNYQKLLKYSVILFKNLNKILQNKNKELNNLKEVILVEKH